MFTAGKVFSSSFASSVSSHRPPARRGAPAPEQKAAARSSDAASIPLTIFGVVVSVHIRLPGSIRSGLNPKANQ